MLSEYVCFHHFIINFGAVNKISILGLSLKNIAYHSLTSFLIEWLALSKSNAIAEALSLIS